MILNRNHRFSWRDFNKESGYQPGCRDLARVLRVRDITCKLVTCVLFDTPHVLKLLIRQSQATLCIQLFLTSSAEVNAVQLRTIRASRAFIPPFSFLLSSLSTLRQDYAQHCQPPESVSYYNNNNVLSKQVITRRSRQQICRTCRQGTSPPYPHQMEVSQGKAAFGAYSSSLRDSTINIRKHPAFQRNSDKRVSTEKKKFTTNIHFNPQ